MRSNLNKFDHTSELGCEAPVWEGGMGAGAGARTEEGVPGW